ncbi:OLC1v1035878C1 [Oldenlandia corymbosa var. corymbosa]|uniref:OLC1v1035878C1 n=1 Tax=Oldenlandia corymbosa var. corymbosa TaxID=529605 RepID=A0AAV1CX75_OLDCO|nr:OLC1v1035878C1 [Oldenlandia corymbosa var. corymbosa]
MEGYLNDKTLNVNESEDTEVSLGLRYKDLSAITLRLITRAAERKDTTNTVKQGLLKLLESVDEILQDLNVVDVGKVKGIKVRPKPTSSTRLKSGLEKSTSKKRAVKKTKTSSGTTSPKRPSNNQVHKRTSEHIFAANPATMRMTDLLMAQQIPGYNQFGISHSGEQQSSGFDNFGTGDNLGSCLWDEMCGYLFPCLGDILCTCKGK